MTLCLDALKLQYSAFADAYKPALLEYIWGRADIKKQLRMDFLIEVMRSDPSLRAVEYAGRYFTAGANLKIKPVAVDYLTKWWDEHRGEIKD